MIKVIEEIKVIKVIEDYQHIIVIFLIQWSPLNVISLGQTISDPKKQMITSTKFPFSLNLPPLLAGLAKTT